MSRSAWFEGVEVLTFDCYGTIVDWETGILRALVELFGGGAAPLPDDDLLVLYGEFESRAQAGAFRSYRAVLEDVARAFGADLGVEISNDDAARFARSVGAWPPFPDSVDALRTLGEVYRLVVVSNVDDDLFARTADQLGVPFSDVVTAEQVRSYKPAPAHFEEAHRRIGLPREAVVHVAQSIFHDVAPAKALGYRCVWIDRRGGRSGGGATPPAEATPDRTFPDLASLASEAT